MAEHDSEWYFGSRLSVNKDSSTTAENSRNDNYNNEDSDSTYEPSTQIDCARSSSSSFDSDEFSDEESCSSSEESIIDLEKLKREQIRLMLKKISKDSSTERKLPEKIDESNDPQNIPMKSTSDYPNNEEQTYSFLKSQPCPLGIPHKLAVQMLKIKKYKPSIKEFSPPVSQVIDGSAYIPEIKRTKLPIESRKADIISVIRENRVIVLSGSTGCGKVFIIVILYFCI
jgi:hypothetical protein